MVLVMGKSEAATAERTNTRTEAMEEGSGDATAGWNGIERNGTRDSKEQRN